MSEQKYMTVPLFRANKVRAGANPLVMVTAYDAPGALIADRAGVDAILVGDSMGNTVLGYEDTLAVTIDDMVRHTQAVARVRPHAMVIADMPWMTYHVSKAETLHYAAALIRAGAQGVKLEGGRQRTAMITALTEAEIPVMGHLGLTPQSRNVMGGYKVQARELDDAIRLIEDARLLVEAGCFSIVLEGVPDAVAMVVTELVDVPTIGIGAGISCDGQVLVFHDVLWLLLDAPKPNFVRRYDNLAERAVEALTRYARDVRTKVFPSEEESYHLSASVAETLRQRLQKEGKEEGSYFVSGADE